MENKTQEKVFDILSKQTDEDVLEATILEKMDILDTDPSHFDLKDWEAYHSNFEKRHGISFDQVKELLKQYNPDGLHDHTSDPLGKHKHTPDQTLSGGHSHTEENPFGYHIHNEGEPLSGSHLHSQINLKGVHLHDEDTTAQEHTITPQPIIQKGFERILFVKQQSAITESLVIALKSTLERLWDRTKWFLNRVNEKSSNSQMVKLNNIFLGLLMILKDDLKFMSFANGVLTSSPSPFRLPIQKQAEVSEENRIDPWDVRHMNEISETVEASIKLMEAVQESIPENFPMFKQQLTDTLAGFKLFQSMFPEVIRFANANNLIRVGDTTGSQVNPSPVNALNKNLVEIDLDDEDDIECSIMKADQKMGIVTGVVLEPDTVDLQGQFVSAPVIEKMMINYMMNSQKLGFMHKEFEKKQGVQNPRFRLIESYIAPQKMTIGNQTIKKGSWVMSVMILDAKIKKAVLEGKITGFSIGGRGMVRPTPGKVTSNG